MARQILIVESSPVMRWIIQSAILANLGDTLVVEASDGEEALALADQKRFDLILSAWEMPKLDGVQLFHKLSQLPEQKRIPFVLLTSKSQRESLKKVTDAGISEYLNTPFEPAVLIEIINRLCNPLKLRTSTRFSIPGSQVVIEQGSHRYNATLVNISLGGLLCDLAFVDSFKFAAPGAITVAFPESFNLKAENLYAALVNMSVLSFCADHTPKEIRVAYKFITVTDDARTALQNGFRLAEECRDGARPC